MPHTFQHTVYVRFAIALLGLALSLGVQARGKAEPYPLADALNLVTLLPPPPAAGSDAERADLAAVLATQKARSAAQIELAKGDAQASVFRFADAVGPGFDAAALPQTARLFERLTASIGAVVGPVKDHWNRPRPFVASTAVEPLLRPDGATYPSGHGTLARLYAIVLADLLPQKRREIFARGDRFAQGRIVNGVHYPSDIDAGFLAATAIAAELRRQPAFRDDLTRAREEIAAWQANAAP
ncbi:MAG TPA: phosphatase PAP2 family protein [Tahibacter sp.]|uniref:acid phosphatase n=1 Tax=Tahibacter sp. TaxID=2056211 RepID=UPI002C27AF57|nr:phosphatase PAP2 family protein [Tahibacter sp.]HSX62179.1 phosphatase PAP2 family protein [Tahibacter sp.]